MRICVDGRLQVVTCELTAPQLHGMTHNCHLDYGTLPEQMQQRTVGLQCDHELSVLLFQPLHSCMRDKQCGHLHYQQYSHPVSVHHQSTMYSETT